MSNIEQTLSIIKPDAVERNLQDQIKNEFKNNGFEILKEKKIHISKEEAEKFYKVHESKPFYNDLCAYLSSHSSKGPITTDTMKIEPCRWLESMIRCARAWDMQQHQETVSKLSRSFGSYTGLSITIPMCFSYCWAEALCAVTNSNPIREKDVLLQQPKFLCSIPHKQEGVPIPSVALSLLWSSGPVVHLEICFEWFIDVAWTHFVDRINEHCYSFRPVFKFCFT